MSVVDLARLQFAVTTGVHWLFVILTMGLAPIVAIMHSRDPAVWGRMTRFWGQLYLINYAVGIATGIVMEFQFGLSWSGLSTFAGNVFGAPLALETLIAFFAESTFLGMWIFGWGRMSRGLHVTLIWLVALTAYASAYFILVANGFMQRPVGFEVRNGVAYLTDFAALLTNPSTLLALGHVALAALTTGGVFVAGIAAFHLARGDEAFRGSLRLGVVIAAVASFFVIIVGDLQVPLFQPEKKAALDGTLGVALDTMTIIGNTVSTVTFVALFLLRKDRLVRWRPLAYLMTAMIPFPFVASVGGWLVREVGRQPWLVYGQLTVADALSEVSWLSLAVSCAAFIVIFVALAVTNWTLLTRIARRGPESAAAPEPVPVLTF
ncbi:cytochrome ubiquinol oxidase subunit I [Nonomuraea sp. NPDC050556]|uniref:cytochrome ubiquinol oxidase subunit I n=1 Tax=Nonomuraea sp. NPDC050556 TaxID=3364369 RepID=UPI0037A9A5C6